MYARAASATADRSALAQPGPSGPSSMRRTSSVVRASACSRSKASRSRQSWPCSGRRWGSQPSQDHSRRRSSAARVRSVLISTISRSNGECRAASCATADRARPDSRGRGPASPSDPASRRPTVTGTAGRPARSAVPRRTTSASGCAGPRSHSRGPGPRAVRSTAAGSGQVPAGAAGRTGAVPYGSVSSGAAPGCCRAGSGTGSARPPVSRRAQAPMPPRRGGSSGVSGVPRPWVVCCCGEASAGYRVPPWPAGPPNVPYGACPPAAAGCAPPDARSPVPAPGRSGSPASVRATRRWPSPSGVVVRDGVPGPAVSRSADSPSRSRAPGASRTGRSWTGAPSSVVPLVESRSATETRPSSETVTAQCSRETSGSSSGTSASAERPILIRPPCSRWTPPASGPATTWSRAGTVSSALSSSPGVWSESTAPSTSGGSPRAQRWVSRRSRPAYSTTAPPPWEPSGPAAAAARPEATAASAVPAGAVTSTSQARAGVWPLRGARTVSRICIAVSGPFCAGCPAGERPCDSPTGTDASSGTGRHGGRGSASRLRAGGILAPASDNTPGGDRLVIMNGRVWA